MSAGIGGMILGIVEKQFPNLPTMPVLGRAGTVAAGAYFMSKNGNHPWLRDVALAAASIAGYQLGTTGKISGDDVMGDDGDIAGLAAQV